MKEKIDYYPKLNKFLGEDKLIKKKTLKVQILR